MAEEGDLGIGPAGYHQQYYADRGWQMYSDLLAKVLRFSRPGPILDLGSGCGYFVEAACRWNIDCIGFEGSVDAIRMAKERNPELDIRHQRLSGAFPLASDSIQTVVLNQVIEHLEPNVMRNVLVESNRVLKSGGMMLITSPSKYNKREWKADLTHINLLSPLELRVELECCGFERVIPFNSPLSFFGNGRVGRGVMDLVFKTFKYDFLSASANAMSYKK